jgi:hypothetical protein
MEAFAFKLLFFHRNPRLPFAVPLWRLFATADAQSLSPGKVLSPFPAFPIIAKNNGKSLLTEYAKKSVLSMLL